MPRKLSRSACIAAIGAALAVAGAPSAASASACGIGATTQAFAPFGDTAWYYTATGGSFEDGLSWPRSGYATVVTGNEPFMVAGLGHSKSLRLRKDASVTTPKLCVSPDQPHLRFFAKSAAGGGQLDVEVRFYGADGKVTDSSSGSVSPSDHVAWAPSRNVMLKVDKLGADQTGYVDVRFKSQGDWLVDDVMVDPLRRG